MIVIQAAEPTQRSHAHEIDGIRAYGQPTLRRRADSLRQRVAVPLPVPTSPPLPIQPEVLMKRPLALVVFALFVSSVAMAAELPSRLQSSRR